MLPTTDAGVLVAGRSRGDGAGRRQFLEGSQPFSAPDVLRTLTAREVMTANPLAVSLETKLSKVMELIDEKHIQNFPVVDDGRFVGMLTERDLHDAMPSVLTVEDPETRRRYLRVTQVVQVLPRTRHAVSPETPLAEVIRTMRTHRIGGIAVTEGQRLVGVLTSGDLITLLERILRSSEGWRPGGTSESR
jgi:acetoin utilization protein AcuB